MNIISRGISLPIISCTLLIGSCKKTEIVHYEKEPANHIAEYKVTNVTEQLYGVVDDVDNTITVYIPYYLSVDYIAPKITLEEGATLIDANGNKIDIREDLEPVAVGRAGYTYRVKDEKNVIRQYTLTITIVPFKDKLSMGYRLIQNDNGVWVTDPTWEKEANVNSRITIYGNLESSSDNAKLTLVSKKTNAIVPNALTVYQIGRNTLSHFITLDISPDVDSGYYSMIVQHQGRTDTLPTIHMKYKKPFFGFLPKGAIQGDTVTLTVSGAVNSPGEDYAGVNTGVTRAYLVLTENLLPTRPANFPQELYNKQIELEILGQKRSELKFRLPAEIPAGFYEVNMSAGGGEGIGYHIGYSGFAIYFDFKDQTWGNDNLLASMPFGTYEIKAKN